MPLHTEALRQGIRVVCEMMITVLKDILLRRRMLHRCIGNESGSDSDGPPRARVTTQQNRQNKVTRKGGKKVVRKKKAKSASFLRDRLQNAPVPVSVVSVDGMDMDSSSEDRRGEVIVPDDPFANIEIKEEIQDDLTFEEHFEDLNTSSIKTEPKEEISGSYDNELRCSSEDPVASNTAEGSIPETKASLRNSLVNLKQETEVKQETTPLKSTSSGAENKDFFERPYVCRLCYKSFVSLNDLKKHALMHKNKNMKYKCKKCSLKFAELRKLKKHLLVHKKDQLKICKCCGRKFSDSKHFSQHKLLHIQAKSYSSKRLTMKYTKCNPRDVDLQCKLRKQRPYRCRYCIRSFTCLSSFKRHAYIHSYRKKEKAKISRKVKKLGVNCVK